MFGMPDANGRRRRKTDAASRAVSGSGLWLDAGNRGSTARAAERAGAAMTVMMVSRARDLVGSDRIEIEPAATVRELRRLLCERYPKLASLLKKSAIAVNDEFVNDDTALAPNAEVALLPPVSGG